MRHLLALAVLLLAGCAAPAATTSQPPAATEPAAVTSPPTPIASAAVPSASASHAPHVTPIADATDSDLVVPLAADGARWDVQELTAPAAATWTLDFDNQDDSDGLRHHNFTIASGPAFEDRIYQTEELIGPARQSYEIPGLPAGTYDFVCTLHPGTMTGELIIE